MVKKKAQAEEKKHLLSGWSHLGGDEWCCRKCGHVVFTEGSWEHPLEVGKLFCEHCGTDMRNGNVEE